jgi:arylsulfatase A-like enzyme
MKFGLTRAAFRSALKTASWRTAAAIAVALVSACGTARENPAIEQQPRPALTILISLDTLRPDHLGVYGYHRPTSPTIDSFAQQAVVFENASSTSPWTLPSHASLLSGKYPRNHRLTSHERRLPFNVETIAARLKKAGFDTRAVVNSQHLSNRFGLEYGFSKLKYIEESVGRVSPSSWVTEQAIEWIAEPREHPLFLFMHYYDAHSDYAALPHFREVFENSYAGEIDGSTAQLLNFRRGRGQIDSRDADHLIDLYDAGVRQTDEELGRLFAFLREIGKLDTALVILTSDHGEEFLEHGSVLHGETQYAEVLQVPLIFRYPPALPSLRVDSPVSLVDVLPTILSLLGEAPSDGIDGLDLSPLWSNPSSQTLSRFAERALFSSGDHLGDVTRSIRQGNFKLIYNSTTQARELYDLRPDPGERVNIAGLRSDVADRLEQALLEADTDSVSEGAPVELTAEEKALVEALGYGTQ